MGEHRYEIRRFLLKARPLAMGELPLEHPLSAKHKSHEIVINLNLSYYPQKHTVV